MFKLPGKFEKRREETAASSPEQLIVRDSSVAAKLERRQSERKPMDVLITDVDGTLYINYPGTLYIGKNPETKRQIKDKNVPFIVNTGRPAWDEYEDERLSKFSLPVPDAVIAGTGTMVYWRQQNGELLVDEEYAEKMKQQKISYRDGASLKTAQFNPELVTKLILPQLRPYIDSKHLVDVLVDQGPLLPDGTFSIEGLRLVVVNLDYDGLKNMAREISNRVSGLKIDFAEASGESTAKSFTGWIHIIPFIPSIAGKDGAAKYVLKKIGDGVKMNGSKVNAHIIGDASNDIRMLAMGSNPKLDPYVLHQYGLQNLPEYTRTKLEGVVDALSGVEENGSRRAHLSILKQKGPDGVYEVVNSLQ